MMNCYGNDQGAKSSEGKLKGKTKI